MRTHAILGMLEEDEKTFSHVVTEGLDDAACARLGFPSPGEGLLDQVVVERVPVRATAVGDGERPLLIFPGHPPAGSFLGVPVTTAGQFYGVLAFVDQRGGGQFDLEDQGLAESLAAHLAIAYEDARRKARDRAACRAAGAIRGAAGDPAADRSGDPAQPIGPERSPRPPWTISAN